MNTLSDPLTLNDENLVIKIRIEAERIHMQPEEFIVHVMRQWMDARYSGVKVPRQVGYSGL